MVFVKLPRYGGSGKHFVFLNVLGIEAVIPDYRDDYKDYCKVQTMREGGTYDIGLSAQDVMATLEKVKLND